MLKKKIYVPLALIVMMVSITACQSQTEGVITDDELKAIETTVAELEDKIEDYEEQIDILVNEKEENEETIAELEVQIQDARAEVQGVEDLLLASNEEIQNLQEEKANLQTELEETQGAAMVGEVDAIIAKEIIKNLADEVIETMSQEDMATFSTYIHPEKGVRFTQYSHIFTDSDLVFTKEEVSEFGSDETVYTWGIYDGSGEDIVLTPMAYYDRFVYDEDYKNADEISYNTIISSSGMMENQFEIYENAIIVEYYFDGFDPEFYGMDWSSLRIVYEKYKDNWYIVGIIHNEWTI
jgi:hypothetical protein